MNRWFVHTTSVRQSPLSGRHCVAPVLIKSDRNSSNSVYFLTSAQSLHAWSGCECEYRELSVTESHTAPNPRLER